MLQGYIIKSKNLMLLKIRCLIFFLYLKEYENFTLNSIEYYFANWSQWTETKKPPKVYFDGLKCLKMYIM